MMLELPQASQKYFRLLYGTSSILNIRRILLLLFNLSYRNNNITLKNLRIKCTHMYTHLHFLPVKSFLQIRHWYLYINVHGLIDIIAHL